jgi:[protein-PII] uridylyltransferase
VIPEPVARLLEEVRALDRASPPGHHGRRSAARRAELVDACLLELFAAEPSQDVALVALGGYGRRQLAPASDIDLLILHAGDAREAVGKLAARFLYPLWNAGLTVGHAVRTHDECLSVAAERLDAATAMLDARPLAGDAQLWEAVHSELVAWARADPRAFAERLRDAARARRDRYGAVSYLLEPELKEGGGGLRDVDTLGWLAAILGESPGIPTLDGIGLLRAAERAALEDAEEFLLRVRSALHLQTGRATDRLLLDQQPQVAVDMGFTDEPGLIAVDGLMRSIFEHARQVEHVRDAAFDRYLRGESVVHTVDASPAGVLRAFAIVASERGVIPAATLDLVEVVDIAEVVDWDGGVREAFFDVLRSGEEGARALETLDRIGLLAHYIPAWAAVRCRPQRDPYHRYSVDVHLLRAFGVMAKLLDASHEALDPLAAEASELVRPARDAVLLGALLHDIGKTGYGNHVAAGTGIAAEALDGMGLPAHTRDLALFMVKEHLLLSDTATRRDLEDDDLVHDVAARIGEPERLAALYLLAIADAQATGPLAWTPWRATLVRELVAKVQHAFERGDVGVEAADRLAERVEAIRGVVAPKDQGEIDGFLSRMPRTYVVTLPVERIAEHIPLAREPIGPLEVRTLSGPGTRPGTYSLTVVASDRPGLLSLIAGALSLAGLSILTAQAFTTQDSAALDVFEVEGLFEPEVGPERWRDFRSTLRTALEGRGSIDSRVADKRAHYARPRSDVAVRVAVDNDASDAFTVIEIAAADRIGLLFDITRTFAELQVDVHLAKVATYGVRVIDAFYVRDGLGRKLVDDAQISGLERALRIRLET